MLLTKRSGLIGAGKVQGLSSLGPAEKPFSSFFLSHTNNTITDNNFNRRKQTELSWGKIQHVYDTPDYLQ